MTSPPPSYRGWFFAVLACQLGGFTAVRLLLFGYLEYDEAEELFCSQTFSLGYGVQPPLYTWLLWVLGQVFGPGVWSLTILKAGLLAALYLLLERVARQALRPGPLASLAALSPLLMPVFVWDLPRMTATLLLCVLVLGALLALARLADRGRTRDHLLLGVLIGLGGLTKYNFALFAVALLIAAASLPAYRRQLLDWRLALCFGVALLMVAPHACWMLGHVSEIRQRIEARSEMAGLGWNILAGVRSMGGNLALAVAVPCLAGGALFWRGVGRGRSDGPDVGRLVGRFLLIALALLLLMVLVGGMRRFRTHWFGPLLPLLAVWLLGRLDVSRLACWRMAAYASLASAAAAAALLIQASALLLGYDAGKYQTRDFLIAEQAAQVRATGFAGTIVAPDTVTAGYQRLYFPDAPVHCAQHPACPALEGGEGLLVVWLVTDGDEPPEEYARYLAERFGVRLPAEVPARFVEVPARPFGSAKRLGYLLLPSS